MHSWAINGEDIVNDRTYAAASTRFHNQKIFEDGGPRAAKAAEVSAAKISGAICGVYKRDRVG
jgi:hypothetical protein